MKEGARAHRPGRLFNNGNTYLIARLLEITVEGGPQGIIQAIAFAAVGDTEREYIQVISLVTTCCMIGYSVASIDRGLDATPSWHILEVRESAPLRPRSRCVSHAHLSRA